MKKRDQKKKKTEKEKKSRDSDIVLGSRIRNNQKRHAEIKCPSRFSGCSCHKFYITEV